MRYLRRPVGHLARVVGAAAVFGTVSVAFMPLANEALARPVPMVANTVALAQMPPEARTTYRLIRAGGPFPYAKDAAVFVNRERALPQRSRGFYREYTVRTPGAGDRGARRIVCAGFAVSRPEACFYTDNHYSSFRQIVE